MPTSPLKISVVTPSLNQGAFLEQALRSVLDQGDPNLEYVVVDGGSTDESADILRKYADRLAWSCSEPDKGHADAVNKGFAHTSGEIMAWLNSDDMYCPWTLQLVREIFEAFPDIEWITGIPGLWNAKGHLADMNKGGCYVNKWDFLDNRQEWIQQESTFWRRSLWERAGGHVGRADVRCMIDGELWSRFFEHAELWRVETLIGGFRQHGANQSTTHRQTVLDDMANICAALHARMEAKDPQTMAEYHRLKASASIPSDHPCHSYPVLVPSTASGYNTWEKRRIHHSSEVLAASLMRENALHQNIADLNEHLQKHAAHIDAAAQREASLRNDIVTLNDYLQKTAAHIDAAAQREVSLRNDIVALNDHLQGASTHIAAAAQRETSLRNDIVTLNERLEKALRSEEDLQLRLTDALHRLNTLSASRWMRLGRTLMPWANPK